jgi:hypothetical protein
MLWEISVLEKIVSELSILNTVELVDKETELSAYFCIMLVQSVLRQNVESHNVYVTKGNCY